MGNKIANRITKVSRSSPENNSEIITNEYDKEIPKERCLSPEERQKISDDQYNKDSYNSIMMGYKKLIHNQPST